MPHRDAASAQAANTTCPRCGAQFGCGALSGGERCWCMTFPNLPGPRSGQGCYCPACLMALTTPSGATGEERGR